MKTAIIIVFFAAAIATVKAQSGSSEAFRNEFFPPKNISNPKSEDVNSPLKDSTYMYFWDTITSEWLLNSRNIYDYEEHGWKILDKTDNYISSAGFEHNVRAEYTYNQSGRVIDQINFKWDKTGNNYVGTYRVSTEFDSLDRYILNVNMQWNVFRNDWVNSSKSDFKYFENNKVKEYHYYNFDTVNNIWLNFNKSISEYDSTGTVRTKIDSLLTPDGNQFYCDLMTIYTYDSLGREIKTAEFAPKIIGQELEPDNEAYTEYDSSNLICIFTYYRWITAESIWMPNYKSKTIYTNENKSNTKYTWRWDNTINDWIPVDKVIEIYTVHDIFDTFTHSYWDEETSSWIFIEKYEYEYNDKDQLSTMRYSSWKENIWQPVYEFNNEYDSDGNHVVSILTVKNSQGSELVNKTKWKYYYTVQNPNAVFQHCNTGFVIYPNPVRNCLVLSDINENSELIIYDPKGNVIMRNLTSSKDEIIDISQLPAGFYTILAKESGKSRVGKFVKVE